MLDVDDPVVFFNNGLGDHFLNLPALRATASLFPGRLTLICGAGSRQVFFSDLPLRAVCEVEIRSSPAGRVFDAHSVAQAVKCCDFFLSLNPWHSPAVDQLLDALAVGRSIGFFPAFRTRLPLDFQKHSAELAFDIPRYLDPSLELETFSDPPPLSPASIAFAQALRSKLAKSDHILIVHNETQSEKMWPWSRFEQVLNTFLERHPTFYILVVGRKDPPLQTGHIISCAGIPLEYAFALVQEADLFLGIDSCMLHAADFFRIPGVGLFGPTNCAEFGFRLTHHRHVCGWETMESIQERDVLDALESLLAETKRGGE